MPVPLLKITTIELPVGDLSRAIAWYDRVLGYAATWSDQHHAMLGRRDNPTAPRLLLVETADSMRLHFRSSHTGIVHSVVDFETDDLDAMHAHLAAHIPGLPPIPPPPNAWAPRGFGFSDSEGNQLAVFSYAKKATSSGSTEKSGA